MDGSFVDDRNSECPPFPQIFWQHFFQLFLIQISCDSSDRESSFVWFRFAVKTDNHARLGNNASICELKRQ